MTDYQECHPIHPQPVPAQQTSNNTAKYISRFILTAQHYAKIILCVGLFLIMLSLSLSSQPQPHPQSPVTTLPSASSMQYPQLPATSTNIFQERSKIAKKKVQVQQTISQILNQQKPNFQQLDELHKMVLNHKQYINRKKEYHKQRSDFFSQKSKFTNYGYLSLQKFNMVTPNYLQTDKEREKGKEDSLLGNKYHLGNVQNQIPFCAVVYGTRSSKKYATEYLLTSLFNQNYSNLKIVIVYDDIDQDTLQEINNSISYQDVSKIQLIVNEERMGYWASLKVAVEKYCQLTEVVTLMNLNDQLLGFNVLKIYNAIYQLKQANVVYSNFMEYHTDYQQILKGYSMKYNQIVMDQNLFRESSVLFGFMFSFRRNLFKHIQDDHVTVPNQRETQMQIQVGLFTCLLELSCGKVQYIPEYFYLFQGVTFDQSHLSSMNSYRTALQTIPKYKCFSFMDLQ